MPVKYECKYIRYIFEKLELLNNTRVEDTIFE